MRYIVKSAVAGYLTQYDKRGNPVFSRDRDEAIRYKSADAANDTVALIAADDKRGTYGDLTMEEAI